MVSYIITIQRKRNDSDSKLIGLELSILYESTLVLKVLRKNRFKFVFEKLFLECDWEEKILVKRNMDSYVLINRTKL